LFVTVIGEIGVSRPLGPTSLFHQLDASVGASGPHDFAVRKSALSSAAQLASIASRPYVRDDRETPLCVGRDGEGYAGDLGQKKMRIFLRRGLDHPNQLDPVQQISLRAQVS
jgi:hypothetical protein